MCPEPRPHPAPRKRKGVLMIPQVARKGPLRLPVRIVRPGLHRSLAVHRPRTSPLLPSRPETRMASEPTAAPTAAGKGTSSCDSRTGRILRDGEGRHESACWRWREKALASQRRQAMDTCRTDPELALKLSVPDRIRRTLPPPVRTGGGWRSASPEGRLQVFAADDGEGACA